MMYSTAVFLLIVSSISAKVYFKENFNDKAWEKRWTVPSDWKPKVEEVPLLPNNCISLSNFNIIRVKLASGSGLLVNITRTLLIKAFKLVRMQDSTVYLQSLTRVSQTQGKNLLSNFQLSMSKI